MNIQKWIKNKGLVDTLLVGSRSKPIYLEALLKEFEQDVINEKLRLFSINGSTLDGCNTCIHNIEGKEAAKWCRNNCIGGNKYKRLYQVDFNCY